MVGSQEKCGLRGDEERKKELSSVEGFLFGEDRKRVLYKCKVRNINKHENMAPVKVLVKQIVYVMHILILSDLWQQELHNKNDNNLIEWMILLANCRSCIKQLVGTNLHTGSPHIIIQYVPFCQVKIWKTIPGFITIKMKSMKN